MSWFKKKYSVCSKCQVHFEPATGMDANWPDLCSTHRKPVKERHLRKISVITWAEQNWEKLEPQYLEDCKYQSLGEWAQKQYKAQSASIVHS